MGGIVLYSAEMQPNNQLIDEFLSSLRASLGRFAGDTTEIGEEVRRVLEVWPVTPSVGSPPAPQGFFNMATAAHDFSRHFSVR